MSTVISPFLTDHAIVKYNDGEGLLHTDLEDQQRQSLAGWVDFIAAGFNYTGDYPDLFGGTTGDMPSSVVFVPRAGQGFVEPAGGLGTRFEPGWIAQLNVAFSAFSGDNPRVLMARIGNQGAGAHYVHDAADAVNARIDILQVRLSQVDDQLTSRDFKDAVTGALSTQNLNKETSVQVEYSIKNGTPAASPVAPATDAGWAVLTRVRILAGATVLNADDVIDMRMPMRVSQYRVSPGAMFTEDGDSSWSNNGGIGRVKTTSDANPIHAVCPVGFGNKRIIGIWVSATFNELGNEAIQLNHVTGIDSLVQDEMLDLYTPLGAGGSPSLMYASTLFGTTGTNNNDQRPLWTNYIGPHENFEDNLGFPGVGGIVNRLALTLKGDATTAVYEVGFVVAEDI